MAEWRFLSNHALALLCIANDSGIRLREIAASVGITERAAHRIVAELVDGGYVIRERRGRRNHYRLQTHRPLPDPMLRDRKLADLLKLNGGADRAGKPRRGAKDAASGADGAGKSRRAAKRA